MIEPVKPLWKHQEIAVERARKRRDFALFHDTGTGKSRTACNILRQWWDQDGVKRTLVLAPPIVLENWRRELLANTKLKPDRVVVLSGPGKDRLKKLTSTDAVVYITNYETLLMQDVFDVMLKKFNAGYLVSDEAHKCKDPAAKRTKRAVTLSDLTARRLILTGTPVLNNPMDLFAQYRILDHGATFGTNFWVYRAEYFYDKNAGMPKAKHFPDWRPRPGALEAIGRRIALSSMTVNKRDCLDLPPLVRQPIYVEMSPTQRRLYDEMRDDFVSYLGDKACVANLVLTKSLRLMQILSGHVALGEGDDAEVKEIKDTPREQALHDLLEELAPGHKILVWAVFKADYAVVRRVCEKLKIEYVEVHGEVSQGKKIAAVDSFNNDPKVRVFLGHPGSGGIGINLVASDVSIWYSRSYSLEHDVQAEARNLRGGSEIHEKIIRYDLVCPGTLDEVVLDALAAKQEVSAKLLQSSRGLI